MLAAPPGQGLAQVSAGQALVASEGVPPPTPPADATSCAYAGASPEILMPVEFGGYPHLESPAARFQKNLWAGLPIWRTIFVQGVPMPHATTIAAIALAANGGGYGIMR